MHESASTASVELEEQDLGALALSRALFAHLDRSGIPWCVVGDTSELASRIRSDIDIVVDPAALPRIPALIDAFARARGVGLVQALRHEAVACYYALAWRSGAGVGFLHPDICGDWWRHGRRFLAADDLLEGRVRDSGGFMVPAPARNAVYYLLKRLSKGELDASHGRFIARSWNADPHAARVFASRWLSTQRVAILAGVCAGGDWSEVRSHLGAWRREVEARFHGGLGQRLLDASRRVERAWNPTGVLVEVGGGIAPAAGEAFLARWRRAFRRDRRWNPRGPADRVRLALALRRSSLVLADARRDPRVAGLSGGCRISIPAAVWTDGGADQVMLEALSRRTRARLGLQAAPVVATARHAIGEAG